MSATVHVLLPALTRFESVDGFGRRLARADRLEPGAGNERAVGACFQWSGDGFPVAALVREHLAHDAGEHRWMCADLAHVKPDMTGVRLLACANLDVTRDEADALVASLQPLFADSDLILQATLPSRWHVRVPTHADVPPMDSPAAVLGDDLIDHLPEGSTGKRWRQLLNEVQIILHQHPVNEARAAQGKPALNSLWFWGAGCLPTQVGSDVEQVFSDTLLLAALASRAGIGVRPLVQFRTDRKVTVDTLLDLGRSGDPVACRDLMVELLNGKRVGALVMHFAGGERFVLRRSQRWRVWRRAP